MHRNRQCFKHGVLLQQATIGPRATMWQAKMLWHYYQKPSKQIISWRRTRLLKTIKIQSAKEEIPCLLWSQDSIPCLQETTTDPHHGPDVSSPHPSKVHL